MSDDAARSGTSPTCARRLWRWTYRIVLFLTAVRLVWGWHTHRQLQTEIDRIRAAGEPLYPEDFNTSPIPDHRNVVKLFEHAASSLIIDKDHEKYIENLFNNIPAMTDQDWEEVGAFLEPNLPILEDIRHAQDLTQVDWGTQFRSPAIQQSFRSMKDHRTLSRMIRKYILYSHYLGKDQEAVEYLRILLHQTNSFYHHQQLMGRLVGLAIDRLATATITDILPDIRISDHPDSATCPQLRGLIADLLDECAMQEGFTRVFQCERMIYLDFIHLVADGNYSLITNWDDLGVPPANLTQTITVWPIKPLIQTDGLWLIRYMNQAVSACQKPAWPLADQILKPIELKLDDIRYSWQRYPHFFTTILLSSTGRFLQAHFTTLDQRRSAAIALAAKLYMTDHDRRPDDIKQLVPDYLPFIPINPMSQDGRLYELGDLPFNLLPDSASSTQPASQN